MAYITPTQLAEGPGMLDELAQPFGVDVALMAATIAEGDRSAWTADEIAAADAALVSIQNTITRADAEMDAYLAKRGYTLPLSANTWPVLTSWARNIVRYHLQPQRDRTSETTGRIERDYRQTLRTLDLVAAGKITLGAGDEVSSGSAGRVEYSAPGRVFSRDTLSGF